MSDFLFISTRIAKAYPNLVESMIVMSFMSDLPGELSRKWLPSTATVANLAARKTTPYGDDSHKKYHHYGDQGKFTSNGLPQPYRKATSSFSEDQDNDEGKQQERPVQPSTLSDSNAQKLSWITSICASLKWLG
jgi:hypothetical protein